eukprot:3864796-Prymnesium_polylepis.2
MGIYPMCLPSLLERIDGRMHPHVLQVLVHRYAARLHLAQLGGVSQVGAEVCARLASRFRLAECRAVGTEAALDLVPNVGAQTLHQGDGHTSARHRHGRAPAGRGALAEAIVGRRRLERVVVLAERIVPVTLDGGEPLRSPQHRRLLRRRLLERAVAHALRDDGVLLLNARRHAAARPAPEGHSSQPRQRASDAGGAAR